MPSQISKLLAAILICQLSGVVGSLFTIPAIPVWYAYLNKPSFSPPNWLFGPAWLILYTLMGISLYLVRKNHSAVILFLFHLIFNCLWSIIFFGAKNISLAFIDISIMWILIVVMFFAFKKINFTASLLLIPYFLWVSFAAALNYAVLVLN